MADVTYTVEIGLGGTLTDVTSLVAGFTCGGGRRDQFDSFTAGTCTFTIDDRTGDYIPGGGGFWSAETWIGREVCITAVASGLTNVIWCGHVDDIDVTINGWWSAQITVTAVEPLAILGYTDIPAGQSLSAETSGERIGSVLALPEVESDYWTADTLDIDVGSMDFQADTDAEANTAEYLRLVETSEGGRLFIAHGGPVGGRLTFRQRGSTSDDSGLTFQDTSLGSGSLVDGGTATTVSFDTTWDGGDATTATVAALDGGDATNRYELPFQDLEVAFGVDRLVNRVALKREGAVNPQVAEDRESQARYGIRTDTLDGLLNLSNADVLDIALMRLARSSAPRRSLRTLTVLVDTLTEDQSAFVLGVTVGDRLKVVASPVGYATNGPISSFVRVEHLEHRVSTASHTISMQLTTLADEFASLIDGGTADTVTVVNTWDGGDATTVTFARTVDGGTALFV